MQNLPETVSQADSMGVSVSTGLTEEGATKSRLENGKNQLPEIKHRTVFEMFLASLKDKTLIILIVAAAVAIGVEVLQGHFSPNHEVRYIDGIAILCAVLIASLVTTINEAQAAKQFRELSKIRDDITVKVLRNGHVTQISVLDLVVGDIIYFDTGDKLPADGLLLSGVDVEVDQSTLTGESVPVHKDKSDRDLKGGTTVTAGNGTSLIIAVGAQSEIGKLQLSLTESEDDPTPLQERLGVLADQIGLFGLGAAILTFLALALSGFLRQEIPFAFNLEVGGHLLEFMVIAITIIVVAVPEGLPLAVTISLAYSVQKMAKDNNLVRRLASCETMGAATIVCSDKTGTLTKNRMTVVSAWLSGQLYDEIPQKSDLPDHVTEAISDIASINSTAFLEEVDGVEQYVGNPTECALLSLVSSWGADWRSLRLEADTIRQFGFSSDRKRMSTMVGREGAPRLLVKGAPEVLLELADSTQTPTGDLEPIDDEKRQAFLEQVQAFSAKGYRTLAFCIRDVTDEADAADATSEQVERNLVLVAIFAIADPVRPEVKDAIAACRGAGVGVKIVTGDNPLTARTIGEQVGLITGDELTLDGREFREMSDDDVRSKMDDLRILARSVPSDKLRLVNLLRERGEVVAVTGDGTNDAPALKAADVGFSMGLTGTEVAKEASDIVILDDNFASIVGGIQWGRSIFENIRKFLQFQLTVNVVALSTAFLAAVFGFGIPLNAVQLLWVNLIMDTLAALALATEPPTEKLFKQPPHGRHAPLITRSMWTNILLVGGLMVGVLMVTMWTDWVVPTSATHAQKLTFVFNAFVFMQIFNEINARSTRFDRGVFENLFQNPLFLGVIGVTMVLQVVIIQYGGEFFRTVPLTMDLWVRSVAIGVAMLFVGVFVRAIGRMLPVPWFAEKTSAEARLAADSH